MSHFTHKWTSAFFAVALDLKLYLCGNPVSGKESSRRTLLFSVCGEKGV